MKLKFVFSALIIFSIVSLKTFANTKNDEQKSAVSFDNSFTCKVYLNIPLAPIYIYNGLERSDPNYKEIDYQDNGPVNLGIDISYKDYGFAFSKKIINTNDEKICGNSDVYDFLIYQYERKYGIDLIYQHRQGLFIINPEDFGYKEGDPQTIRPDIEKKILSFNFFYATSDDYSFKAAFKQLEKQNKWDWSPMVMFSLNFAKISSDYSIIPPVVDKPQFFGDDTGYRGGRYYSAAIMPGIGITIPFYNFYLTSAMFVGVGITKCDEEMALKKENQLINGVLFNFKGSIGYNGDLFFCGSTFNFHSFFTDKGDTESTSYDYNASNTKLEISSDTFYFEIFIGYRI